MTIQRLDFLYRGTKAGVIRGANPVPFVPAELGLHYAGMLSTACYRGFHVTYELGESLKLRELKLLVFTRQLDLLNSISPGLREMGEPHWECREHGEVSAVTIRDIPWPYTGKLLVEWTRDLTTGRPLPKPPLVAVYQFQAGQLMDETECPSPPTPDVLSRLDLTPESHWTKYGDCLWLRKDENGIPVEPVMVFRLPKRRIPSMEILTTPLEELRDRIEQERATEEEVDWERIRVQLLDIIDNEDKTKPLTDEELATKLKARGLNVSPHAVLTYRTQLGIADPNQRRLD